VLLDAEEVVGAQVASPASMVVVSISISRVESWGRSAMVATPQTPENFPRTLAIRCRATNSNDACDRSTA
jgi:hypothetical protein